MRRRAQKDPEADLLRLQSHFAEFIQRVAHDIQSPVKKILSFTDLLTMKIPPETVPGVKDYLERIEKNAATLAKIMQQLQEFARYSTPVHEREVVDLNETLAGAKAALQPRIESMRAELKASRLPSVRGSAGQLTRLWRNLLSNALDYHGDRPPEIHIDARKNKGEWVFRVSDNGRGVAEHDVQNLFRISPPMSGQDRPSTGIGLALSRYIVENHGGRIWCESAPERGTRISFTLPN